MSPYLCTVTALALLGAACAGGPGAQEQAVEPEAAAPDSVFVEVINDNFYDARIHVIYDGGTRHSVGTVPGHQRLADVAIPFQPRPLVVWLTLVIQGGVYRSDRMDVVRGDLLQVRVPPNLETSGWFHRVTP